MLLNRIQYCLSRIMCNFTFGKLKQYFKNQKLKFGCINVEGKNNIYDKNKILKNGISLKIIGNNNEIKLNFSSIKGTNKILRINIYGDNNKVEIGENLVIHGYLFIDMAYPPFKTDNSIIKIGDNFGLGNMEIMLLENNSKCNIGNNCMFSEGILMRLSDTHSVLDLDGNLLNYGGNVEIGNHVWCGREVRILKNVSIGDDSIIGASSIVAKRFDEKNIVVAGNPAKIIKKGINWTGLSPDVYLENQKTNN